MQNSIWRRLWLWSVVPSWVQAVQSILLRFLIGLNKILIRRGGFFALRQDRLSWRGLSWGCTATKVPMGREDLYEIFVASVSNPSLAMRIVRASMKAVIKLGLQPGYVLSTTLDPEVGSTPTVSYTPMGKGN